VLSFVVLLLGNGDLLVPLGSYTYSCTNQRRRGLKIRSTRRKLVPVQLCPPRSPHVPTRSRICAVALIGWQLTARTVDFILPIQVSLPNYVLAYLLYSKCLSFKQFCSSTNHTPTYEILNCENSCLKINEILHLGFKMRNCKSNGICLSRTSFFLRLLKSIFLRCIWCGVVRLRNVTNTTERLQVFGWSPVRVLHCATLPTEAG